MAEPQSKRRKLNDGIEDEPARCISGGQYGDITVAGHARVHAGDDNSVHHHHYGHSTSDATSTANADGLKTLIDSLTFDRWEDRIRNVAKPLLGTCGWLFEHKHFKAWVDSKKRVEHNGFLWIKGHPGCGKSTIMKTAVDWVKKRRKGYGAITTYFFNARASGELEKSSLGLYRSLAYQLLTAFPTLEQLFQFISEAIQGLETPLCILIDALDEGQESDIRRMVRYLENLASYAQKSDTTLRICLSSRHYPCITIKKGISMEVERESEHHADIARYIKEKLIVDHPEQMVSLVEKINTKSAGIFLWVVLVTEILNQVHDRGGGFGAMKECLRRVPEDLEGLFMDILARSNTDMSTCIFLLQCLLYSTRPLSPVELHSAIQHAEASAPVDHNCRRVELNDEALRKYILNHSRGLVEVTSAKPPVVQFIHETVREFFLRKNQPPQLKELFSLVLPGTSHETLKRACLGCISSVPLDQTGVGHVEHLLDEANIDCPLIEYSTTNLLKHADAAEANGQSQIDFCWQMLDPNSSRWRTYVHCRNSLEKHKTRKYKNDVQLLYVAAERGLLHLVDALIESGFDVNTRGGRYGNALQATCYFGHEEIAERLIASGANVNAAGGEHKHALVAALLKKNFAIAELLINKGATLGSGLMIRALTMLADRKFVRSLGILLSLRFDAIRFDSAWLNAVRIMVWVQAGALSVATNTQLSAFLEVAARDGHEGLLRILLDANAKVCDTSPRYGAPHIAAAANGHQQCLRTLVEAGADVNQRAGTYNTALQAAAQNDHVDVMAYLLVHGADVNDQNDVLYAACLKNNLEAVKLLLDHDADVNGRGDYWETPLYRACYYTGTLELATLLLKRGAQINATSGRYGNALCAACSDDRPKIVPLVEHLLKGGADMFFEGPEGCALVVAAGWSSYEVVQILAVEARKKDVDKSRLRRVFENAVRAAEKRREHKNNNQEVVNLLRAHLRAIKLMSIDSLLLTPHSTD